MKFSFDKKSLSEALSIAQEIISIKNTGSTISNILFISKKDRIYIKATDVKTNYEAEILAQIFEEGSLFVHCNKFIEILNSLPTGEIEVFQKDDEQKNDENVDGNKGEFITIIIKPALEKINFQMKTLPHKKFPEFSFTDDIPYFEISSKIFKEMISQTLFAVSTEEMRYFMNGVFFEKKDNDLILVATDGRRLSFISKTVANEKDFSSVIVHPKILNIVLKYAPDEGSVFIAFVEKKFFCKFSNYKFSAALLEGQFPNYTRVIPKKQSFVFYVKKIDLKNALTKHISLMLDKKIGRIFFNVSTDVLNITSLQPDVGSVDEEIPCKFSGEPCTIAFNFNYIEEPVREINTETIAFEFTEEMKAVTLRPEPAQDYFHIIMPMQKE